MVFEPSGNPLKLNFLVREIEDLQAPALFILSGYGILLQPERNVLSFFLSKCNKSMRIRHRVSAPLTPEFTEGVRLLIIRFPF